MFNFTFYKLKDNSMASVESSVSPIWAGSLQNLKAEESFKAFRCFRRLRNESGYAMMIFELMGERVINIFSDKKLPKLEKMDNSVFWIYPVMYEDTLKVDFEPLFKFYEKDQPDEGEWAPLYKTAMAKFGLNFTQQKAIFQRTVEFAKAFFATLPKAITPENIKTIQKTWENAAIAAKARHRIELCGSRIVSERCTLSAQDLLFLGIDKEDITDGKESKMNGAAAAAAADPKFNPTTMTCSAYAFLKIREQQARLHILCGSMPKDFLTGDPMKYFKAWGYAVVKGAENVREGDMVVYLNKGENTPLHITHVGVMTASGLVESKLGWNDPMVWQHKLEDAQAQFGPYVAFLRKKKLD